MVQHSRRVLVLAVAAVLLALGAGTAVVAAPPDAVPSSQGLGGPNFDQDDVLETLNRWALGYDDQSLPYEERLALMADAFTEDGSFVYDAVGFHGEWHGREGDDGYMALFEGALASQNDVRRHVMTNSIVEQIDRHTVRVTSYLTLVVVADPNEGPFLDSSGIYRDTLVLEEDGTWRIQERHLTLDTPPA